MKIISYYIKAEGMNSGNTGFPQKSKLPSEILLNLKVSVILCFLQYTAQGSTYPLPHFSRSSIGKSNNKQPVNIHGVLRVCNLFYYPFNQHRRLTGSCSSSYQ
jgi:hypothetical protein